MESELKALFAGVMGIERESVDSDSTVQNTPNWDSFRHLELVAAVESRYSIHLSIEEIIAIESFVKLMEVLESRGIRVRCAAEEA